MTRARVRRLTEPTMRAALTARRAGERMAAGLAMRSRTRPLPYGGVLPSPRKPGVATMAARGIHWRAALAGVGPPWESAIYRTRTAAIDR
jgi:hypothetical protein